MHLGRYRGRHLKRSRKGGPVVVGTAAAVWLGGSASHAHAGVHVIRAGETLSAIASRYKTTVARLASMNSLADANFIVAGRRLRVPGGASSTATHVVRSGETLSSIATRYRTSIARVARLNRISNPNFIVEGTKLKVPRSSAASAPAGASSSSIEASLARHAMSHGLDPALVKAVAWLESGWQQDVVSSAGAIGVMQVMPDTARYVNTSLDGHNLKVRRADDNVHLGVMYLRHMLRIMPNEAKALAAYYSGPGNVKRRLDRGQRRYVRIVKALKERFR